MGKTGYGTADEKRNEADWIESARGEKNERRPCMERITFLSDGGPSS